MNVGMEIWFHEFLTLALDEDEWSASFLPYSLAWDGPSISFDIVLSVRDGEKNIHYP
jgi:hypothetical protein